MALFKWNDSYSVSAPAMDAQHRRLIELLNQLHEGMSRGAAKDTLQPVLDQLIQYTKAHFTDEERAMQAAGYPGLAEHKQEHLELTKQVQQFRNEFAAGRAALSIHVLNFLKEWLRHHIMGSDKQYGPWLARGQARAGQNN